MWLCDQIPRNFRSWTSRLPYCLLLISLLTTLIECSSQEDPEDTVANGMEEPIRDWNISSGGARAMVKSAKHAKKPRQETKKPVQSNSNMAYISVGVVVALSVIIAVVAWKFDLYKKCTKRMNRM